MSANPPSLVSSNPPPAQNQNAQRMGNLNNRKITCWDNLKDYLPLVLAITICASFAFLAIAALAGSTFLIEAALVSIITTTALSAVWLGAHECGLV